jgi:TPR repeat protein
VSEHKCPDVQTCEDGAGLCVRALTDDLAAMTKERDALVLSTGEHITVRGDYAAKLAASQAELAALRAQVERCREALAWCFDHKGDPYYFNDFQAKNWYRVAAVLNREAKDIPTIPYSLPAAQPAPKPQGETK